VHAHGIGQQGCAQVHPTIIAEREAAVVSSNPVVSRAVKQAEEVEQKRAKKNGKKEKTADASNEDLD
jgi:hypothetical protein